jgi:hypothetical protein
MPASLEYAMTRMWPDTHRAVRSRDSGSPAHSRVGRALHHSLVRFVACGASLIALGSVVA